MSNPETGTTVPRPCKASGFTLIELMIAVAVVAILALIAIPSYNSTIVKTNRAAGEACLGSYANYMERFYATNLRYDKDSGGTAIALPTLDCATSANTGNNYNYSLVSSALTASAYTLQAVPKGSQLARDTECGTLTLSQTGTRTESGTGTVDTCWKH